jgi:hypothetical protein
MKALLFLLIFSMHFSYAQDDVSTSTVKENHIPVLQPKTGQLGIGVQAGYQSGITLEYWDAESRAINFAVTVEHGNLGFSLAHLWMFRGAFPGDVTPLVPYVGAGLMRATGKNNDLVGREGEGFMWAIQVPLGFEYIPERKKFTVFAEGLPGVALANINFGLLGADAGFRVYF